MTKALARHVPEGWAPLDRSSPFLNLLGPLHVKGAGGARVIGFRIEERHLNTRGTAHGGLLVTLADSALGILLPLSDKRPWPVVTVSLSVDFTSKARLGDWVEAHVEIEKSGERLGFASCRLVVDGRLVLRATGVFAFVNPARATEDFGD